MLFYIVHHNTKSHFIQEFSFYVTERNQIKGFPLPAWGLAGRGGGSSLIYISPIVRPT